MRPACTNTPDFIKICYSLLNRKFSIHKNDKILIINLLKGLNLLENLNQFIILKFNGLITLIHAYINLVKPHEYVMLML
jgi:hypothetical protein